MKFKRIISILSLLLIILVSFSSCNSAKTIERVYDTTIEAQTDTPVDSSIETEENMSGETTKVSFAGCGDNIIYYGNVRDAQRNATNSEKEYDFSNQYTDIEPIISNADISFINQETLMCGEGYELSYYPLFNGPTDLASDLVNVGFDVINMANNHMLDKGADGFKSTASLWKSFNVMTIGNYDDKDDFLDIRIIDKNGIKISFLSYTYFTNGLSVSDSAGIYVPYLDEETIKEQVEIAKNESDFVIVSTHWASEENIFEPSENEVKYAQIFADSGVDVVIGHHPHVIQPIEWIQGKDGNKMLCVYSLGNLIAEQSYDYNQVGGIIEFDIVKTGNNHATAENIVFEPTVIYFDSGFYNNHVYLMKDFTDSLASSHGISNYGQTTTKEKLKSYVTNTISNEFLPDYFESIN